MNMTNTTKNQDDNLEDNKQTFSLAKENYILLGVAFFIIVLGYIFMAGGAVDDPNTFYPNNDPTKTPEMFSFRRITLAPIMVIFGFAMVFFAVLVKPESNIVSFLFRRK